MAGTFQRHTNRERLGLYTNLYDGSVSYKDGIISDVDANLLEGQEGHYGYPKLHGNPDVGGNFRLCKAKYETNLVGLPEPIKGAGAYEKHHYAGNVCGSYFMSARPTTILDASAYGATAYSKMKPTKPMMAGLNAIYELRELPGQLRQRFLDKGLHGISDYWLALQFGWKPLFNDVKNLIVTQQDIQKRIKQLLRDNGRPVRREWIIADDTTDPVISVGNFGSYQPGFVTQFHMGSGEPKQLLKTWKHSRIWAAARFRYWLPPGPKDIKYQNKLKYGLYGLTPTPSVIYNAIPWSWLVDWFTNVGDVIENLDAGVADRLAADYFYVMREESTIKECDTFMHYLGLSGNVFPCSVSSTLTTSTKTRLKGDPFGFATKQEDLSGMQLSILGALGLSRLR